MRVLTFTSLFPNTLQANHGIFLLQRTLHLARREGNQVQVVAPLPYVPRFLSGTSRGRIGQVPAVETISGLTVHHPRYLLAPRISMPLHALAIFAGCIDSVRQLHREHAFDCIDAHYIYPDGVAGVLLAKALRIPVTLTARGSDIHTFPGFKTIRPQIRWALRNATAVAAVSNSLAEAMMQVEPQLSTVEVIGNGVDGNRFFPQEQTSARCGIGLSADDKVIVSVAALRKVKGPDLLVRAVAQLRHEVPKLKVIFAGEGEEREALQQLATALECADVCRFVGAVPNRELRLYYAAANVTCLPSRKEGWPNVVLESLACGTPVVGTRVGAVPEILRDPEMGLVVEPSPESIRDGLRQALKRGWNREAIVAHATKQKWDDVAERVEDLLRRSIRHRVPKLQPALSA